MAKKRREPAELSREELVALVEGLREVMYGDVNDEGREVWNSDMEVSGADLVEWVGHELAMLGLVPEEGPRV